MVGWVERSGGQGVGADWGALSTKEQGTPAPTQLLASVSFPVGRGWGPAGLYIFLTGPSSEARKNNNSPTPQGDPFVR